MQAEKDDRPELARHLKSRHVQLIAIGGTIGTGLFLGWSIDSLGRTVHFICLFNNWWHLLFANACIRRVVDV